MRHTSGVSFQGLSAGRNDGKSDQLTFLLYRRLIECVVPMTDLMTRGSQDICRSPPLAMAGNRSTVLVDRYQAFI